ncbi:electron transport complex subunit RsxC [Thioalkalivibrio sp.]|uniref:electron transport complex subunit RsxC n=1 Tax=Thioalkalivibrio sp. TaxID=2093813 RepID=UPI00356AA5DC
MQLHHFHGGLKLADHKAESTARPLLTLGVPKYLYVPLSQHIGAQTECTVQAGDRVAKGQRIGRAKDYICANVHAPTSGWIRGIVEHPVPHPSGLSAPCIKIETDGRDHWGDDRMEPWHDWRERDPRSLRERVRDAGIVGMGGAAFPTAVKLNPRPGKRIHTLVVNGAECEPYISCDDMLMRTYPEAILEGARIVAHTVGAERVLFAVEDNKPEALRALTDAMPSGEQDFLQIVSIPSVYPTGGERQLIKVLTGHEVPSAGLPADLGMVCHNTGTLKAIREAVVAGQPLISRIVTVTGPGIREPRNIEALIGTPFADLAAAAGGYMPDVDRLVMGGPMMGFAVGDDAVPIIKGTNCLLATRPQDAPQPGPVMPCIRCGECTRVCPANLLPQQMYWFAKSKDFDAIQDYGLFDCIECGCCAQVCPSNIPLVQYYRFAKQEIWGREKDRQKADLARERFEFRQQRQEREQREKAERLARKKAALGKKDSEAGDKKAVIEDAIERARAKKAAQSSEERPSKDRERADG